MMMTGIRLLLALVAVGALVALVYPEFGIVHTSPENPLGLLLVSGALAIWWPDFRKKHGDASRD